MASTAKVAPKIRYVGRRTTNFGRPLWEIVLNLKDFGVGRFVVPTFYEKYPEPTYYKIVSAEPHVFEYPDKMSGSLVIEPIFRGRKLPLKEIGNLAGRADYRLLQKHEEEAYKNRGPARLEPTKILPVYATIPPVWQEFYQRQKGSKLTDQECKMKMHYVDAPENLLRVAKEGEKPTFEIGPSDYRPIHKSLYDGVVWKRQSSQQGQEKS